MSLNPDMNVLKRNLEHWFKFDNLSIEQGIAMLVGVEPVDETINALKNWYSDESLEFIKFGIPLLNGDIIGGQENRDFKIRHSDVIRNEDYDYLRFIIQVEQNRFRPFVYQYDRLLQYWNSGNDSATASPTKFVEWSLSKNFRPAWLDNAIDFGLYTLEQKSIAKIPNVNNFSTYSTKWLEIQQAAIDEFFNPRRNPDAKKEEVIAWINTQAVKSGLVESNNIAKTIFTIIKPENHDPKKKRIEP